MGRELNVKNTYMYNSETFSEKYFFGHKIRKRQIIKFDIYVFKTECSEKYGHTYINICQL